MEVSPFNTVTLDGSGNGRCAIGPPTGTVWALDLATLSVTTSTLQPQGLLYRGSAQGPLELVDSTYTGAQASSGKVRGTPFYSGQMLWAVWTGGDPGAVATLRAYGSQVPREAYPFAEAGGAGEGFDNPIVAGESLIIPSIHSPNFETGVAGWSINRDGSAEFLDLLVRGIFEAGGTGSQPHITFLAAPNLPSPIDTYQYLGSLDIKSAIVFYATNGSPDDYFFIGFVDNVGAEIVVMGYVRDGDVQEQTSGDPLGLQIVAQSQFPLPPGSVALSQFVRVVGSCQVTGEQIILPGKIYVGTNTYSTGTSTLTRAALAAGFYTALVIRFQAPGAAGGSCAASGGGANRSMAGGGGGGGFISFFIEVSDLDDDITITLGAGGTPGAAGNNPGGDASASSVSDGSALILTANDATGGGGGAASGAAGLGGSGGIGGSINDTGTAGEIIYQAHGGDGFTAVRTAGGYATFGYGGSSFSTGLRRTTATDAGAAGLAATDFGGGGSAAHDGTGNTARQGGSGSRGRVWIDLYR